MKLLKNDMPGLPHMSLPIVDVRDVAFAHLKAMESENSNGNRYLLVSETLWMEDVAKIVSNEFKRFGYKVPSKKIGYCPLKFASYFDKSIKLIIPFVNRKIEFKNEKSINELGINYRKVDETIIDMCYNLIEKGYVVNKLRIVDKEYKN